MARIRVFVLRLTRLCKKIGRKGLLSLQPYTSMNIVLSL